MIEDIEVSDIHRVLEEASFQAKTYPNGITTGFRFKGIPGTRGVHVEVVHVIDLRIASFGSTNLARKSAILTRTNRSIDSILVEHKMQDRYVEKRIWTVKGRITLQMLRTQNLRTSSLIHQTTNVYVVHDGTGTGIDFSWLLDRNHIVSFEELYRTLKGDTIHVKGLQELILPDKWEHIMKGYERSIEAFLSFCFGAIGVASLIAGVNLPDPNLIWPLFGIIFGSLSGVVLTLNARRHLSRFQESVSNEYKLLSERCDIGQLDKACLEKDNQMSLVNELNYSISTLMGAASDAIESARLDEAVIKVNEVLDELIQMSPGQSDDSEISESGLRKVLGLFESLGIDTSDYKIQHAYVAFTGHRETRLSIEEATHHLTTLNNALYATGIIQPEAKDKIDNRMNIRDAWQLAQKGFEEIPDVSIEDVKQESKEFKSLISEISEEHEEGVEERTLEIENESGEGDRISGQSDVIESEEESTESPDETRVKEPKTAKEAIELIKHESMLIETSEEKIQLEENNGESVEA